MTGVRVSIVTIADLSVLQLKRQGENVVTYINIIISVADERKTYFLNLSTKK